MGRVFNKEIFARLQTRNLILIFLFHVPITGVIFNINLNNTQKMFYFRYEK